MTEALELENEDYDSINSIPLGLEEYEANFLERMDQLERKLSRLESLITKLGRVVVQHLKEDEEEYW